MPNMRAARWACWPAGLAISALQATQKINLKKRKVVKNNHCSQPQLLSQDTNPEKKKKKKDPSTAAVAQTSRAWWDGRSHVVLPSETAAPSSSARFTLQTPSSGFHPHHPPLEGSAPSSEASGKNKAILGTHSCGGASGCNGKEAAMLKIAILLPVITIYEK